MKMVYDNSPYRSLITVPANDGNFIAALSYATIDELNRAEKYLINNPIHNKSRLVAVSRELRKRKKGVE